MFLEIMFPLVQYVERDRPIILGLDGEEISMHISPALKSVCSCTHCSLESPYHPRLHLNAYRSQWCIGLMRNLLETEFGLKAHSAESNSKIVYFSASVYDTSVDGDVLHLLLRTTIGAAMTMGVGGITQLECYVRTIAHAVEPPKKKRTKQEGPKMDFFQSGLKKMAERCVADLHTQPDLPGAPTVRDAVRVLGEASNILAGLVARDAPCDPPAS